MRDSAQIRVNDGMTEIGFVWVGFDGDDCFNDFHIDVTSDSGTQQFSFGPCVVHGLRKLSKFFRVGGQPSVGGGFQYPDVRSYDLIRADDEFRLSVRFEGSGLSVEFRVRKPSIQLDDEFLAEY